MKLQKINRNSVAYNAAVLACSGTALQILGFAYRVFLSRIAGAQGLGLQRLVMPIHSVLMAFCVVGMKVAVTKLAASFGPNVGKIKGLVRACFLTFCSLFACGAVPVLFCSRWIAVHILGDGRTAFSICILLIALFFSGIEGIFEALFLGIGKTKYTAVSNVLEQVTQFAGVVLLLFLLGADDPAKTCAILCCGMVVSEVPVVLWLWWVYRRLTKGVKKERAPLWGSILSITLPIGLSAVITTLISSVSVVILPGRLVLSGMSRSSAVAALGEISQMAMPLVALPMVLIGAMSQVLLPRISQSHAQSRQADVARKVKKAFQATGLIALPVTAVLMPLAPALGDVLFRTEFSPLYLGLLAFSSVFSYYQMISGSILNGLGLQKKAVFSMLAGEAVELAATFFLAATPLGIYGYIIGTVLNPLLAAALNLQLLHRSAHVLPDLTESLITPVCAALAMALCARLCFQLLQSALGVITAALSAMVLSGVLYALILRMVGINPFRYYRTLIRQ